MARARRLGHFEPELDDQVEELLKTVNGNIDTDNLVNDSVTKDKINADVAGNGLGQNVDGSLEVKVDDSSIEINTDTLRVKDGGITNAKLANMAVNTIKGRITAGTGAPEDLTAANILSILGLTGITSAWSAFTPSWTNLTVGNGTNEGKYIQIGKTVFFRIRFVFGNTSSISGNVSVTLPVNIVSYNSHTSIGQTILYRGSYYTGIIFESGVIYAQDLTLNYTRIATVTAIVPDTWTTNDYITITGCYECV